MKFAAALALGVVSANEAIFTEAPMSNVFDMNNYLSQGDANGCMTDHDLIQQAEGYRSCPYTDTMGHLTICWGYNLDNSNARAEVKAAGGNYDDMRAGKCTTKSVCENLFTKYLNYSRSDAKNIFGTLSCKWAQAVATDMTYNLGPGGMASFTTFNSLMKQGRWADAAADGKGTAWCRQVGNRCTRNMGQLTSCC